MLEQYRVGNAQIIGRREVQSNYFSTAYNEPGDLFTVLADGSIDHPNGRRAAVLAAEYCVRSYMQCLPGMYDAQFLFEVALKANRHIQDSIYVGKSPWLSLSMTLFSGKELHFFNVGTNKVCLYNGHTERVLGGNTNSPYSCGKCDITQRGVVGMFSVGAYVDAHPMERIKIVGSEKNIFEKSQEVVETINKKRLANQLNGTALLIEVIR